MTKNSLSRMAEFLRWTKSFPAPIAQANSPQTLKRAQKMLRYGHNRHRKPAKFHAKFRAYGIPGPLPHPNEAIHQDRVMQ